MYVLGPTETTIIQISVATLHAPTPTKYKPSMSAPSLTHFITKRPWLKRWMTPLAHWYADAAGYRKLGLRYLLLFYIIPYLSALFLHGLVHSSNSRLQREKIYIYIQGASSLLIEEKKIFFVTNRKEPMISSPKSPIPSCSP